MNETLSKICFSIGKWFYLRKIGMKPNFDVEFMENKFKTVPLDTMIDKYIGKRGTNKREAFENELRIDLLRQAIKKARQERNLTQAQLGELVFVFQISNLGKP